MDALHEFPLTRVPRDHTIKKPHENWGWRAGVLSREEHATSSAWEGSLANGIAADHSGGTTADSHGTSPLPEPASCKNSLRREGRSVNGSGGIFSPGNQRFF